MYVLNSITLSYVDAFISKYVYFCGCIDEFPTFVDALMSFSVSLAIYNNQREDFFHCLPLEDEAEKQ